MSGEVEPVEPPQTRKSWKKVIPAPLRHGVVLFTAALIIEYFVVPDLLVARSRLYILGRANIFWLIVAFVLEALAFFTYALLTRTLLRDHSPSISVITRIDMSTTAIAHVVPGGTAGSAALGYRLLTSYGVSGPNAGFAMATQGMGSAVVLNVLLWFALVISIPFAGFRPVYVTVALVGMLALLGLAALVYALTRGEDRALRFVRMIGNKIPRLGADRLEGLVHHIGLSLRELARNPVVLRRALLWAAVNWLSDAACLWTCVLALHHYISPLDLFVAYGIANVAAVLPFTPGGLGVVELSAIASLVGFGLPKQYATLAVLGWRLVNFWLPIPVGAGSYLWLRTARGSSLKLRRRALSTMAEEARPADEAGERPS